jgi:2-polyprenyl-6-methoxyphenol hydroxylase-like FAD-dependent oxidoreductase
MTPAVAVVGAGPVGLMTACELGLAGVKTVVLERHPQPRTLPKANGLIGQIVPLLDQRGLLGPFSAGSPFSGPAGGAQFGGVELDLSGLDPSPLDVLAIPQPKLERLLAERAGELGTEIRRGHAVTTISQDEDGVTASVDGPGGPYRLRSRYLVGCDGARSMVRQQAGIGFPGSTYPELTRLGHVRIPDSVTVLGNGEIELPGGRRLRLGFTAFERGTVALGSFTPGVLIVGVTEDNPEPADLGAPVTLAELSSAVIRVLGTELPMGEPIWLTRSQPKARLADGYRSCRVFVAGDAAHLFPAGGTALNIGLTDAVNLGWKLGADLHGWASEGLLESYHDERHLAGTRALLQTQAQYALRRAAGADGNALRELFRELLRYPQAQRHVSELLAGADIRYGMGQQEPHPLLGRFLPDLPLHTPAGPARLAELMRSARGVLLNLAGPPALVQAAAPWADRLDIVTASVAGETAAGAAPQAILLRPDGYVAWVTERAGPDTGSLLRALHRWFGSPRQ